MLQVSLLGQFEVLRDGERLAIPTRNAQALLAFLLLNAGQAQRRERLAGVLWPDSSEENARSNLRHELWRLRKALGGDSGAGRAREYILVNDLTITFDAGGDSTLDVLTLAQTPADSSDAEELIAALAGYGGELLPGFYQDWVQVERERVRGLFEVRMARLLELLQLQGRWTEVQEWAGRWIALGEDWPEPAFRALMTAQVARGETAKAVQTYERLAQGLERDLGLEPSEATQALLARVRAGWRPETTGGIERIVLQELRSNLPRPLTSFIGREKEIAQVRALASAGRLVTVTGAGGVGKTRLAIEVAVLLAQEFRDGVCWVELAPLLPGDERVAQTVARALQLAEEPQLPWLEAIMNHLADKELLLVLDNCEHLIDACVDIASRILAACARVSILTTSREPLRVAGEKAWLLPSLTLPRLSEAKSYHAVAQVEAIRLFVTRAADAVPGYGADGPALAFGHAAEVDAAAVVDICVRLDGIPLAIELAAARMNLMSAAEIAARLDSRFNFLTVGRRTALPRHQTLRAAIEWSYELLTLEEKCLFRRLSVFAGSFTLAAAEAVCAPAMAMNVIDHQAVLSLLGQLVDKSLLTVVPAIANIEMATRYRYLDTICTFAHMKLVEADEEAPMRQRHAAYYVALVEAAEPQLLAGNQAYYYRLLQAESDNIRAVVNWSAQAGAGIHQAESGLRIVGALLWFWWSHGSTREGLELALTVTARRPEPSLRRDHTRALNTAAYSYWVLGDMVRARECVDQALALLKEVGDDVSLAWSLQFLGLILSSVGQYERAKEAMQEGIAVARRLGDITRTSFALAFHGDVLLLHGDKARAEEIYEESLRQLEGLGNRLFMGYPMRRLGYLALAQDDVRLAWSRFHESLVINQEGGDRRGVLACVTAMAALALKVNDPLRAARLLGTVDSRLASLSLNLLSLDQLEMQRVREALQSSLDKEAFLAAYAEGREIGDDEMLRLVDAAFEGDEVLNGPQAL